MTKAIPIMKAVVETDYADPPPTPEERETIIDKKIAVIKQRSIQEKRKGSLQFKRSMEWSGIFDQAGLEKKIKEADEEYRNGNFFLERIGRYRDVDTELTMTVLSQRNEWIMQYDIKTVPEFILLDMAMVSYFHFTRLNQAINNIMASIEWDIFALDAPAFDRTRFGIRFGEKRDRAISEELARRLQEVLEPILERYNRMYIRNVKALRDLRRGNIQLNIGNVGQMNIGDKQINVGNNSGDNNKKEL